MADNKEILERLARIKNTTDKKTKAIKVSSGNISLDLDIANLIDVNKEISNLEKEIENLENSIKKTEALLGNKNFTEKADADVINQTSARVNDYKDKLKIQNELLNVLKQL